jgi:hypothetical protein
MLIPNTAFNMTSQSLLATSALAVPLVETLIDELDGAKHGTDIATRTNSVAKLQP